MINFFSRAPDPQDGTVYRFKEPSLEGAPARRQARPGTTEAGSRARTAQPVPGVMPTNYGDIVAFFRRTVSERKSAYNQLCRAADQLKPYIPDEVSRLKVAWSVLGEQVSPDALSLAISTHLGDIDLARQKAARHTPEIVAAETGRLQQEIAAGDARRETVARELQSLQEKMKHLQARCEQEDQALAGMRRELESLQSSVNSAAFLDQAAENEKNDLLAKKVLLGLE